MTLIHTINVKVAESAVGRWFRLDGSGHVSQTMRHAPMGEVLRVLTAVP